MQSFHAGFALLVILVLLSDLPGSHFRCELHAQTLQQQFKPIETSFLRDVEKRMLPPCIVPGPWIHESLPSYYWAANPELKSRFDTARSNYENRSNARPCRALTLVAGAAGVGKSFIKSDVFSNGYPADVICKFDIKELYDQWRQQGTVDYKPDLCCDSNVLNTLLSCRDSGDEPLLKYLIRQDAACYVIDSLDEIHPDDYVSVLRQIERFVYRGKREFVHVVVFGRPFALRDYWHGERARGEGIDTQMYMLDPPVFRTTGDLQVSSWNYHSWRYKLDWAPNPGKAMSMMSLPAYAEWTRLGFERTGDYRTVSYTSNLEMTPHTHATLTHWARKERIVASMLGNLAGNSILREIAAQYASQGRPYERRAVLTAFLQAWLQRGTDSDDRPSASKPEFLDLYLRLLERVAVKYLVAQQVDQQGYFIVGDDDSVEVIHQGGMKSFRVRRILDRSGLVCLDPFQADAARYRFEPIWLHRLLVEMHNEQSAPSEIRYASKHSSSVGQ